MCNLSDYDHLKLCANHKLTVQTELNFWHEHYLPVRRNVLDIGAGCGETAFFYLQHGADEVCCIEANSDCYSNLVENFKGDRRVIAVPFLVNSIKIDIEGAERDMIFETHFPFKIQRLAVLARNVYLNQVKEDWGSILRKGVRKLLNQ